jgi:hypothetical protein
MLKRMLSRIRAVRDLGIGFLKINQRISELDNLAALAIGIADLLRELRTLNELITCGHRLSPGRETEAIVFQNGPHGPPHSSRSITSRLCTMDQFLTENYKWWCNAFGEKFRWHRKQWEFYYISESLWLLEMLACGKRGLGFGIGQEPLPGLFASLGCDILATDLASDDPRAVQWACSGEHSACLAELNARPGGDSQKLLERLSFRQVDMNDIPENLKGFDFLWSSCALEHLGSLELGKRFILQSLKCLKPGGIAVHTTEYNVSSDHETFENERLVLFRKQDILGIQKELAERGHYLFPLDFYPGDGFLDRYVAYPPSYREGVTEPHLKLKIEQFVVTSIGLVVKKAE